MRGPAAKKRGKKNEAPVAEASGQHAIHSSPARPEVFVTAAAFRRYTRLLGSFTLGCTWQQRQVHEGLGDFTANHEPAVPAPGLADGRAGSDVDSSEDEELILDAGGDGESEHEGTGVRGDVGVSVEHDEAEEMVWDEGGTHEHGGTDGWSDEDEIAAKKGGQVRGMALSPSYAAHAYELMAGGAHHAGLGLDLSPSPLPPQRPSSQPPKGPSIGLGTGDNLSPAVSPGPAVTEKTAPRTLRTRSARLTLPGTAETPAKPGAAPRRSPRLRRQASAHDDDHAEESPEKANRLTGGDENRAAEAETSPRTRASRGPRMRTRSQVVHDTSSSSSSSSAEGEEESEKEEEEKRTEEEDGGKKTEEELGGLRDNQAKVGEKEDFRDIQQREAETTATPVAVVEDKQQQALKKVREDLQRRLSLQQQSQQRLGTLLQRQREQPKPAARQTAATQPPPTQTMSAAPALAQPNTTTTTTATATVQAVPPKPQPADQNVFAVVRQQIRDNVQKYGHFLGKTSSLTSAEQNRYLELQKIVLTDQRVGQATSEEHAAELTALGAKVARENAEYRTAEKQWSISHSSLYHAVHPTIAAWVEKYLERKRLLVSTYYGQYYDLVDTLPIEAPSAVGPAPSVELKPVLVNNTGLLLGLGNVLNADYNPELIPAPRSLDFTLCPFMSVAEDRPQSSSAPPPNRWRKKMMPIVSRDENALRLGLEHKADFVVSASAIEALLCNVGPHHSEQWEVPVTVKAATVEDAQGAAEARKVIVLDKPLAKKAMTAREKNTLFFEKAHESMLLRPDRPRICFDAPPGQKKPVPAESDKARAPSVHVIGGEEVNLAEDNLTYALWKLGDLRLLIRLKMHGYLLPDKQNPQRMVEMLTKLEYMPTSGETCGPEEVTLEERIKWWIHTALRPQALLLLGRVDMLNGTVRTERYDMALDVRNFEHKAAQLRGNLHHLLQNLTKLEEGRYLLAHESQDPVVKIYQETPASQGSAYDLHAAHSRPIPTNTHVSPWLHSDQSDVLHRTGRIPYVFPPAANAMPMNLAMKRLAPGTCCYAYALSGFCAKGNKCTFPHLSAAEVQELAAKAPPQAPPPVPGQGKKKQKKKGSEVVPAKRAISSPQDDGKAGSKRPRRAVVDLDAPPEGDGTSSDIAHILQNVL